MASHELVSRDERGHWLPGTSGNPGGRTPVVKEVVLLAREHTREAITTLASIAVDPDAHAMARVRACEALLARAWGVPTPERDFGDGVDGEVVVVRFDINADRRLGGRMSIADPDYDLEADVDLEDET